MHNKLYEILSTTLNIPQTALNPESSSETISAWDSMATLNLALALESSFGIKLNAEEILNMDSLPKIKAILNNKGIT